MVKGMQAQSGDKKAVLPQSLPKLNISSTDITCTHKIVYVTVLFQQ